MLKKRGLGVFVAECNECGEEVELSGDSPTECAKELREQGWAIIPNGQEWEHYCPEDKPERSSLARAKKLLG